MDAVDQVPTCFDRKQNQEAAQILRLKDLSVLTSHFPGSIVGKDDKALSVLPEAQINSTFISFPGAEKHIAECERLERLAEKIASRMRSAHEFAGSLFLIGGKSEKTFDEMIKLCPKKHPKVVVVGRASERVDADEDLAEDFVKAGIRVEDITIVVPKGHESADKKFVHSYRVPKGADIVFFGGGQQDKLRDEFDDRQLRQVNQLLRKGAIVGGSSAGAAIMSAEMINGGNEKKIQQYPGFGLAPWAIIDTHVGERGRQSRGCTALYDIGKGKLPVIGLDEDTRVKYFWKGGKLFGEIGGKGTAHWIQTDDMPEPKITNRKVMSNIITDGGKREAVMWELKAGDVVEIRLPPRK